MSDEWYIHELKDKDREMYDRYKKVGYVRTEVKDVSVILFEDGYAMINDWYDAKRLGIKQIRIRRFDELKELIELRRLQ